MRTVLPVALLAALVASPAAADECLLKKSLKVSIQNSWKTIPAGSSISITKRGQQWATVDTKDGAGKTAVSALEGACAPASSTAAPPPEPAPTAPALSAALPPPAEPALVPAAAVVTPTPAPPPEAPLAAPPPTVDTTVDTTADTTAYAKAATKIAAATPAAEPAQAAPSSQPQKVPERLVAILDVKAGKDAEGAAAALTTMLTAEVAALPDMRSVSRNELKSLISHQADATLVGCEDVKCFADVAHLVNADLLIAGQLDRVEDALVLSLSLIDAATPAVVGRQEAAWRGKPDEMLALVRPLVQRLTDGPQAHNHKGTLEVFATEGATLVVDGREVGTAPLPAPLRDLATGVHTIEARRPGFVPLRQDVVVARNETTIARADLEEEPLLSQPWFWATAGGVVLVAGGTAAGITTWAILNQPQDTRVILGK